MPNAKIMAGSSFRLFKLVKLSVSVQAKSKDGRRPQRSEIFYLLSLQKLKCFAGFVQLYKPRPRRNLKTKQLPVILDLCLRKIRAEKSRDYRIVIVFEKFRLQNVFRPH